LKLEVLLEFINRYSILLIVSKIFDATCKEDFLATNILFTNFKILGYSINYLYISNLFI